ncbi:MAG: pilus assembly protein N-terminal domain-containing protein [Pseudomonadota bacterium]
MRTVISAAAFICAIAANAQAGQVLLTMDQVRPMSLERPAESIVVGNPAIADVTVQDNQKLLLFGKAPGLTNIYIFDDTGAVLDNLIVRVRSTNSEMLTFHRGAARTTYNCAPNCEATVTVGDDNATFTGVAGQVAAKYEQAAGAAGGAE